MQWSLFLLILMGHWSFFTCHLYEYHFIGENKTWYEARKYCREKYTDLATVFDMTDMKRLRDSTENQNEAWIGLYNKPGKENQKWHWSLPGVEFSDMEAETWVDIWMTDNDEDLENCVQRDNNEWKADTCTDNHKYICYNGETSHQSEAKREEISKYKVILIKESKTWEGALNYCRSNHSDLASIINTHQQRWVQERAKNANTPHVWLGLRYTCTLDLWFFT